MNLLINLPPAKAHKLDPYNAYIKERNESALPIHLSAAVILREIKEQGYDGGLTRLRQYLLQLRGDKNPTHAFIAALGYSHTLFVHCTDNMRYETLEL